MILKFSLLTAAVLVSGSHSARLPQYQRMGGPLSDFFDKLEQEGSLSAAQANDLRTHYRDVSANRDSHGTPLLSSYSNEQVRNYLVQEFHAKRLTFETLQYTLNLLRLLPHDAKRLKKNQTAASVQALYSSSIATANEVEFLGRADPANARYNYGDERYNGIWHYTVGTREYILQAHSRGLYIVDATDPSSPFRVQFIPMVGGRIWRDVETYAASDGITYAYVAAQSDGTEDPGTLFVVDLSALSGGSPNAVDSNPCGFVEHKDVQDLGHTVTVSANGLLLLNSASGGGCHAYDLKETPMSPQYIGQSHSGPFSDCHDSFVRIGVKLPGMSNHRDLLYSADGYSGRFSVVDITDIRQGRTNILGQSDAIGSSTYAHFGFPSEDGRYLYAFEESNTYDMAIFDVSDPSNIVLLSTFQYSRDSSPSTDYTVHNGQVRGNRLFVAYYEAGFRVFDISDPTNPVETGFYNTYSPSGFDFSLLSGSKGAWNVYVKPGSDKVYVSDQDSGAYMFGVSETPAAPRSPPAPSPRVEPTTPRPNDDDATCTDVPSYDSCYLVAPDSFLEDPCSFFGSVFPEIFSSCCYCGGGIRNGPPATTPVTPQDPVSSCRDVPDADCSFVAGFCDTLGFLMPEVALNCCECGGGVVGPDETGNNTPVSPGINSDFGIDFVFLNESTERYEQVFLDAAATISRIILNDLPDYDASEWPNVDLADGLLSRAINKDVDDVLVIVSVEEIDGVGNVLGAAGPLVSRPGGQSPISGVMVFDEADFAAMDIMDIRIVVLHEMLHVLGLGAYWKKQACAVGCETRGSTEYTCPLAAEKYRELGLGSSLWVSGGEGGCHWSDTSFSSWKWSDIMTPTFDKYKQQLITTVTIAALADLGYTVNYGAADAIPSNRFAWVYQWMIGNKGRTKLKPTKTFQLDNSMVSLEKLPSHTLQTLKKQKIPSKYLDSFKPKQGGN